ncbi:MAG: hypothetical protein WC295_01990 [Methanoregula sp.]
MTTTHKLIQVRIPQRLVQVPDRLLFPLWIEVKKPEKYSPVAG